MLDNTPREPRYKRTPPRCAPSVRAWAAWICPNGPQMLSANGPRYSKGLPTGEHQPTTLSEPAGIDLEPVHAHASPLRHAASCAMAALQ